MTRNSLTFLCLFLVTSGHLYAQRAEPEVAAAAVGVKTSRPAPRLAQGKAIPPVIEMGAAAAVVPDELADLYRWNEQNRTPLRNGFTRAIGEPVVVTLAPVASSKIAAGSIHQQNGNGGVIWSGSVKVKAAYRLRLRLTNLTMPPDTQFWIYAPGETPIAFGTELIDPEGNLYTPSVGGELLFLEVETPASAAHVPAAFTITDVVEIVQPFPEQPASLKRLTPNDTPSCLVDATCVTASTLDVIDLYRRGVAHLQYVKSGSSFVCTGGLINDKVTTSTIPYFLTANHCFSTQSSATSLEAFWDYKSATCTGSFPNLSSLPRSNGSQMLATSAATDFTFIRLNSIPANRILLGWDAAPPSSGTLLHRISHPFPSSFTLPAAQAYSNTTVNTTTSTCTGKDRPNYIYSNFGQGGVYGGSSGSPVILSGGYVVGQLFGTCGPDPTAGCNTANKVVDGALSATFPQISTYLNGTSTTTPCVADTTTACMLNNRFKVRVRYRGSFDNLAGDSDALVKPVTGFGSAAYETAFFYFNNPNNIEMLVKLLDQGNVDSQSRPTIAVLFGSATPLRVELTITDSQTGAVKNYVSEFPQMKGTTDFTAFLK